MAIVEDEVRNESEEENEIEVVVEEYEGEQDSDDSEDDDDAVDEALERKVAALELQIKADPYAYDDHIELVKALWALSDLDRWRTAFDRVTNLMALKPEDWLLRLRTEISLSHSAEASERIAELFQKAVEDCYSIKILSEWCSWCLSDDNATSAARQHLKKVVDCAGADPLSGKVFWDALFECEKAALEAFRESDADKEEYQKQRERVCRSLEEAVSRPLLRGSEAWPLYEEYAIPTTSYGADYVARTKKDHELALEYLQEITPFEDRLLTVENLEEKMKIYEEYIETVKGLLKEDKYSKRDGEATLRVLYDRATTECPNLPMLQAFARHVKECFSSSSYRRAIRACSRRWPRTHHFWTLLMQQAERDQKGLEEVNSIFEGALLRGMESYKEGEQLWLSYVEYKRRQTNCKSQDDADHMRNTFRLAWDSLATLYGDEANDCEIPLYWARFEYQNSYPKEGKEVFEEIFRYGENRTMSKYWETLIRLEMSRVPPTSEEKLRALFRRALKAVTDYPPAIATLWTDYERDYGKDLEAFVDCAETCENKIIEWREYYKTMKEKMTGKKQNSKQANKKNKFDKNKNQKDDKQDHSKKHNDKSKIKGKRKSDGNEEVVEAKKKKEDMEVDEPEKDGSTGGVKRSHDEDATDTDNKRLKTETNDSREQSREACTLFVSNLDFKFDEDELRQNLSQFGDIVHFRVRKGTKAFGGAICYCQYKNIDSVDNALKHDRSPLAGRPMFFSRYAAKKTRAEFKYSTTQETNKLFVKNLPFSHCTKEKLTGIFEPHGKLKDIRIVTLKDGKPRGLAYVDYEDEASAAAAIEHTNGMLVGERKIEVAISAPPPKTDAPASLGLPKRDSGGGMRRTQLSSFIPSVLQRASTSKAEPQSNGSGTENKPKSNSDFRSLLLASKK